MQALYWTHGAKLRLQDIRHFLEILLAVLVAVVVVVVAAAAAVAVAVAVVVVVVIVAVAVVVVVVVAAAVCGSIFLLFTCCEVSSTQRY